MTLKIHDVLSVLLIIRKATVKEIVLNMSSSYTSVCYGHKYKSICLKIETTDFSDPAPCTLFKTGQTDNIMPRCEIIAVINFL